MTFGQLMDAGGVAKAIKGPDRRRNVGWKFHAPRGFRFSSGEHEIVSPVLVESDELRDVSVEKCGPGCRCR